MSSPVEIPCPNCKKALKVPPTVFGKKIKCKYCEHAFVVEDPEAKPAKPAKPGAKPAAKAEVKPAASPPPPPPPPPAPAAAAPLPFADDDEGVQKVELIKEEEIPRCPHCAKELDPPEAMVCIHCGFNSLTREKAETKKVWEPEAQDWINHLAPGVAMVIIVISLLILNIMSITSMREWLGGSILESEDEKDILGRKKLLIAPGFFIFLILIPSLLIMISAGKFAYRRLVLEYKPPEKEMK